MRADKRTTALLALLVAVIFIGTYHMMRRSGGEITEPGAGLPYTGQGGPGTSYVTPGKGEGDIASGGEKNIVPPLKISTLAWQRNPFIPLEKPRDYASMSNKNADGVPGAGLELEGIIRGGKRNVAIINGKSVREGGYLGEWKLVSVGEYGVTLTSSAQKIELNLVSLGQEVK